MYVLARHVGESIIIDGRIEVKVISITGKIARIGVGALREVKVARAETTDQEPAQEREDARDQELFRW